MAVAWVAVFSVLLIYMFGCICTTFIGLDPNVQLKLPTESAQYFGNVQRSMLSLIQIMTLDSWASQITRPFMEVFPATAFFFVFFMILSALGLMNLLAAIYVDKLMKLTNEEAHRKQVALNSKKQEMAEKLHSIFLAFDKDGNGILTDEELLAGLNELAHASDNPDVDEEELAVLNALFPASNNMNARDMQELIEYLKKIKGGAGDSGIHYVDFIEGMFQLYEPCTQKDALKIMAELSMKVTNAVVGSGKDTPVGLAASQDVRIEQLETRMAQMESSMTAMHTDLASKMDALMLAVQANSRVSAASCSPSPDPSSQTIRQ